MRPTCRTTVASTVARPSRHLMRLPASAVSVSRSRPRAAAHTAQWRAPRRVPRCRRKNRAHEPRDRPWTAAHGRVAESCGQAALLWVPPLREARCWGPSASPSPRGVISRQSTGSTEGRTPLHPTCAVSASHSRPCQSARAAPRRPRRCITRRKKNVQPLRIDSGVADADKCSAISETQPRSQSQYSATRRRTWRT